MASSSSSSAFIEGSGSTDWYRILNAGFRFPCLGASDYPACRKLGDCVTYVHQDPPAGAARDIAGWFRGASDGRSFVTTGPILLLEVDGQKPGSLIAQTGPGPAQGAAKARVISLVAPVTNLQLMVNGRVD